MRTLRADAIVNRIAKLVTVQDLERRGDADLVKRFAQERDEAAFEVLLKRHGPMILRLCRRLSPSEPDAEDVFQATFLVLARKASSLKKTASVGPWLYGIATRLAAKSRTSTARRQAKHASVPAASTSPGHLDSMSVREAEQILHEELARLPRKYRDALVLCFLEGKTRDEAARTIGCKLGTLKDRLHHGKELLRSRLVRRGVGLPAAFVANLISQTVCNAALSDGLIRTVVQSAIGSTAAISAQVSLLVEAGLRSLAFTPVKVTMCLAATLMIGAAVGLSVFGPAAAQPAPLRVAAVDPVPEEKAPAKDAAPRQVRLDSLGDPLPDGALMRLGTRRHRVQTFPLTWQPLPDGKSYIALQRTGSSNQVRRLDSNTGVVVETWPVPERFNPIGFSPDGRYLLMGTSFIFYTGFIPQGQEEPKQEWVLRLYDLTKRQEVWANRKLMKQEEWIDINECRFSSDGKWIVGVSQYSDAWVVLVNAATGAEVWRRKSADDSSRLLGFADGDKVVAFRGGNGAIHLFDRAMGNEVRSFPTASVNDHPTEAISPDGGFVLLGGGIKQRIWDMTGKEQPVLDGHSKPARQFAFSKDGKTLFTAGNDPFVLERKWPSGEVARKIALGRGGVGIMIISSDGKRLEVKFTGEQALAFYDLETGKPLPAPMDSHRGDIYGVATAPDGKLISFSRDATVRTWDIEKGKAVDQLAVNRDFNAGGFALSRDGRLVAVPKADVRAVNIYDRAAGKLLRTLPAEYGVMRQLSFSSDGRWLAAVGLDRSAAQVWDADTGKEVLKLPEGKHPQVSGTFSNNGKTFCFAEHGLVRFFDTATWQERPGLEKVYASAGIAFSPDDRTIATASVEGVRLFETSTGSERLHLQPVGYPSGALRFSPDGRFLAWNADRTIIHVYDVWTGAMLGPFTGHDDVVNALTFTNDSRALASASADSTILLWDVAGSAAKKEHQEGDVDRALQTLMGDDAKAAFEAMRTLAASPEKTVKSIAERLRPAEPLDPQWVAARLRDLDSPTFAVRDRATRELEELGERVAPILETFLARKPSAEACERAERIVTKLSGSFNGSRIDVQTRRSFEILERIGGREARLLMERLAQGAEGAVVTNEAKATLARWRK